MKRLVLASVLVAAAVLPAIAQVSSPQTVVTQTQAGATADAVNNAVNPRLDSERDKEKDKEKKAEAERRAQTQTPPQPQATKPQAGK